MKILFIAISLGISLQATAQVSFENLATRQVEKFVSFYGKNSISIKKSDGSKYTKLRKELSKYANDEVLNLVLDDQAESSDLAFKLSILFSSEANSNYTKQQFNQPVAYVVLETVVNAQGTRLLITRTEESKLNYEVQCGEKEDKNLLGIKTTEEVCLITNAISKED